MHLRTIFRLPEYCFKMVGNVRGIHFAFPITIGFKLIFSLFTIAKVNKLMDMNFINTEN